MLARNPHTVATLISWLEKQPKDGRYPYCNNVACLLCQYYTAMGVAFDKLDTEHYWLGEERHPLPAHFDAIARGPECNAQWSYGEALARAHEFA